MKRFFTFIMLLMVVGISSKVFAQTTVFTDLFKRATYNASGAPATYTFTNTLSSGTTAGTCTTSTGGSGLYLGGITSTRGRSSVMADFSAYTSPFVSTLKSNTQLVTWTFNMRPNRSSGGLTLLGTGSGTWAIAAILCETAASPIGASTNGYAVIGEQGSIVGSIAYKLVKFTGGLNADANLTTIVGPSADLGGSAYYSSIKVVYNPSNDNWSFFFRDDGVSVAVDPTTITLAQQVGSNTVNTDYVNTAMTNFGFFWNYSGANAGRFDNFKVVLAPQTTALAQLTNGIAASPISSVDVNKAILGFSLTEASSSSNVTTINFNTSATSVGVFKNVKLYTSTDNDYSTSGDNTQVTGVSVNQTAGQIQLSGFTVPLTTAAKNFFLVADAESAVSLSTTPVQLSLTQADITLTAGTVNTATITGTNYSFFTPTSPTIVVSGNSLSFGPVTSGNSSSEQTYTVSGSNLTESIVVSAPSLFEVSKTSGSGFSSSVSISQSGGTVGATTIYVRFSPSSGDGVHSGNITNTSAGATQMNVAVSGTGTATEPTTASSAISFSNNTSGTSYTVGWTNGNGASHIVLVKSGSAVNSNPVDGTTYTQASAGYTTGTQIGTGNYVLYSGAGSSVTVSGLTKGTIYYFTVYEFNGSGGIENYLTSSTVSASQAPYGTITAGTTGLWSATGTWTGGAVPGVNDNVIIPTGITVTVGATSSCANLTVNSGGTLISNGTNIGSSSLQTLRIYGTSLVNNGTVGKADGTDGIGLGIYNSSVVTISGSGTTTQFAKITPYTATQELKISTNIYLTYRSSSTGQGTGWIICNGAGVGFSTLTIDNGSTMLFAPYTGIQSESTSATDASISWTMNISGTMSTGSSGPFAVRTAIGSTGTINVLSGGVLNVGYSFSPVSASSGVVIPTINVDGTLNLCTGGAGTADFSNPAVIVSGSGTVSLTAGGIISIASADGITAPGTSLGPIRTAIRSFSTGASYTYIGTSAQVTGSGLPSTVYNLTINNSNGVTLSGSTSATYRLTLTSGLLHLGDYNFALGTSASVSGTPSSSLMVVTDGTGVLVKNFSDAQSLPYTFTFPVGETTGTTEYSPVAVTINTGSVLSSASISAKVVNAKHGSNTSATDYLNRYWTLASSGITSTSLNVSATYLTLDINGTETNLWTGQYNAGSWTKLNAATAASNLITATSITSLGDFTGGEAGAFVSANGFVTITLIPEGYYRSDVDPLPVSDVFTATLASATGPDYADVETANVTIDANTYTGTATFTTAPSGSYYLYVKGIALMATWTAAPITFTQGSTVSYDFTDAVTKAYAIPGFPFDPMIQQGTKWTIYSGDVDQDELIGNVDLTMIDNDAFVTLEVHGATDLDGDALVGNVDLTICDNHAFWVVESQTPRKVGVMANKYLHKPVLKRTNSIQK